MEDVSQRTSLDLLPGVSCPFRARALTLPFHARGWRRYRALSRALSYGAIYTIRPISRVSRA